MKVKITKTIDIANLPGETRRMLDQAKNELCMDYQTKCLPLSVLPCLRRGKSFSKR